MYNKLKRLKGEQFAKTIRDYHNGILEIPNLLDIVRHAGDEAEPILQYLISLINAGDEAVAPVECPFDLLDRAGYYAVDCSGAEYKKALEFKKFYAEGELICTFNSLQSRCENYKVIFAAKKNAADIKRAKNPEREDDYGTSVISIQFKNGFCSIKNRYNHSVPNCDNTFKSNPDNIIPGLTKALEKKYGVELKTSNSTPEGYMVFSGKLVKINYEVNGVFVGDHCYFKDGNLVELDKEKYALYDYFVFDRKQSKFVTDLSNNDCFLETFNKYYEGVQLEVRKDGLYETATGVCLIGV